jgi:hypothetical protein
MNGDGKANDGFAVDRYHAVAVAALFLRARVLRGATT